MPRVQISLLFLSIFALVSSAGSEIHAAASSSPATVVLNGTPAPPASFSMSGFRLVARPQGPQVAVMEPAGVVLTCLEGKEDATLGVPLSIPAEPYNVVVEVSLVEGRTAVVGLSLDQKGLQQTLRQGQPLRLEFPGTPSVAHVFLHARANAGPATVRWSGLRIKQNQDWSAIPIALAPPVIGTGPPAALPNLRPALQQALLEWDWRLQDGIDTPRQASTYAAAIERTLTRGDLLLADLKKAGVALVDEATGWEACRRQWQAWSSAGSTTSMQWQELWERVHRLRRQIALRNPLVQCGPLVFVKQVPSIFSHQLTQYYGSCARPGGGLFVLEQPGRSLACRPLVASELPLGSFQFVDVSFDGSRVLFSYCHAETTPTDREKSLDRVYHLYEINADGTKLRELTRGTFDDFAPRYLPDGRIVFLSTRRQGFHRCGRGPCPVYTLAVCEADGSNPHPISYHETHEWDPAVLNDGRILYTRWDYVDRHAVHYQQLWSARPDGSQVRAYYGNNTWNPVGVWEARPVPGSSKVMATAAAHHAMTAGSIILLDVTRGSDGLDPITRLTPDVLFPESEMPVLASWYSPLGVKERPAVPQEQVRWPGHCYRSPYPLAENYFIASYSYDSLVGEPGRNPENMFGIYLVDRFGNKELLYRDPNIASLWAMPLRPCPRPPVVAPVAAADAPPEGTFFLQDVSHSWPTLPPQTPIKRLRIVQVLPKSTPHINSPPVGIPNASPGRQVLGTVPVEPDGSAYFRAPARIPLAFQALDEHGQAVQTMRSLTYLQPGEQASCVGCHERQASTAQPQLTASALKRPPSRIEPGPDGSRPFSYPLLVQPVLDNKCVVCHNPKKPEGKVILTGEPQGHYTVSYNALAARVPYSAWGHNHMGRMEPMTYPDQFGARASPLMKKLLAGHAKVVLTPAEIERLATWMDTNVLFYGTFDPVDQTRQRRGERIAGPKLE